MKRQNGFTLVELMIVVAIIGILAAIAIPKFRDMMEIERFRKNGQWSEGYKPSEWALSKTGQSSQQAKRKFLPLNNISPTDITGMVEYFYDGRTGFCFARYNAESFTWVPCDKILVEVKPNPLRGK